jgi:hypothetical protein
MAAPREVHEYPLTSLEGTPLRLQREGRRTWVLYVLLAGTITLPDGRRFTFRHQTRVPVYPSSSDSGGSGPSMPRVPQRPAGRGSRRPKARSPRSGVSRVAGKISVMPSMT